ncbi:MAG: MerC domain-containing protein [Bacteroidota bacterium]
MSSKSDLVGATASALCLAHCILTPFLFVAQANIAAYGAGETHPAWWSFLDIVFLVISLAAVWYSAVNSVSEAVQWGLWISWIVLCFIILNEKLSWMPLPEAAVYVPAIALVLLHLYNRKYCKGNQEASCE